MSNEATATNVQSLAQFRDEIQPMHLSRLLESDDPEQVFRAVKQLLPSLVRRVSRLNLDDLLDEFEVQMFDSRRGGEFHDAGLHLAYLLRTLEITARDFWARPGEFRRNDPGFLKLVAETCFFLFAFRGGKTNSGVYYQVALAGTKIYENLTARQYHATNNQRMVKFFYQLAQLLNRCANEPTVAK